MEDLVSQPAVSESSEKVPTQKKVSGVDGLTKKRVDAKNGLNSKSGVGTLRATRVPSVGQAGPRRNSTDAMSKRLSDSCASTERKNAMPVGTGKVRRSLPELSRSMISETGTTSSSGASVGGSKKSGPASPGAKSLRRPTSFGASKSDSIDKLSLTQSINSLRKGSSSSLDSTSSSTTQKSLSKLVKPSAEPRSVTSGLKRVSKLSPSLASSSSQRNVLKNGSMSSLGDQGSSLYGTKKVATPEHKDSRLVLLPPVEIKGGDDVRLVLRGQRIRNLSTSGVNLSQNLEFVYLRDNLLSSLEGVEILKHVKVLDLSFNDFKGPAFEPLGNCKVLQQLYLAGNQITSLSSLPELPSLEFLSVAQNKIKSLSMASQPRLQVLAASKNKISSLKGFPHLPVLEHLRVEENPILRMPHIEAASILLVGPTLKKYNDRDLSEEEIDIAKHYPAHTAVCIRDGWEFCLPDRAAESTFNFLLERWKDQLPSGFHLKEASIDPPFEEDACRCHFIFIADHASETKLILEYQWYVGERALSIFSPIPGAVAEVYCPRRDDVGKCLKVECIPVLGETKYPPIFAISSQVSPGTRCPKVLNLEVCGDLVEGNIVKGCADVAWCGGTPGKGVASWLRRKWNSSPVVIAGAEEEEYQLTLDDIGSSLVFMYTPVTGEGTKGEPQYAITDFVKAAPPSISNVRIIGDCVEGNALKGVGDYFGGQEGPSKFEWLRQSNDLGEFELILTGSAEYTLTREDVGCRIAFVYMPVNFEGKEGESASMVSDVVKQAPPKVRNTRIIGELREGSKITVTGTVTGGTEGASRVQWFKSRTVSFSGEDELETLSTSKIAKAFRIPLGAVGHYIVAKFTPMTPDGDAGEPAYVISETAAEKLPPSLNFLSVTGDYVEGEMLTASYGYIGGHEGKSIYSWYLHEAETDAGILLEEYYGHLQYRIPKEAIGKFISFKCVPARDDGMTGEPKICMGLDRVRPGCPRLLSLQIVGMSVEGSTLLAAKRYWGGEEGDSIFRWFRIGLDGQQSEINGATTESYTLSIDDVGSSISVSCEPVRSDLARGPIVFSGQFGPVIPGRPTCQALEFSGAMMEGQRLSVIALYSGGERGNCIYEWFRVKSNGIQEKLSNDDFLDLALKDVGCQVKMVFTPVRSDGERGTPKSVISDVIMPADPVGLELTISTACEAEEMLPRKRYFGGNEGLGQYIWYRTKDKLQGPALNSIFSSCENVLVCGEDIKYTPSIDDVGAYLALYWVPTREDGKQGKPLVAISDDPVLAAQPEVFNVRVKALNSETYVGEGEYFGGHEGSSLFSWYRESSDGTISLIHGAESRTYKVTDSDYKCHLLFGYTPVRSDSVVGELKLSDPTDVILPELLEIEMLALTGAPIEGDVLTAVEVIPSSEQQKIVWDKYKKEVKYQWYYYADADNDTMLAILSSQHSCSYKLRFEDIGRRLRCECIVTDVFGRSSEPTYAESTPILPGIPKIDKLEIEGRGFHTNLYAIRGVYSGGKEGKSRIQWLRSMVGSPDLISIPGETGRMYEANVDDVGYRLVVIYTPVREDGVEGQPMSSSTEPIAVEPDVLEEVKKKLDIGSVKFEVLCNKAPASKKVLDIGGLERRILEINRKRVKVVKPGSKTSFPSTEMRGTYAPPFHVVLFRNDQHRLRVVADSENEVDIMVHTRHLRDVIVLVLRGLAQKFNSTSLNSLLKMET